MKLTDKQTIQLQHTISGAIEDLRTAVFHDGEDATFLSVGASVGLAIQKLTDTQNFLEALSTRESLGRKNTDNPLESFNEFGRY